jgi:hypothetical protein
VISDLVEGLRGPRRPLGLQIPNSSQSLSRRARTFVATGAVCKAPIRASNSMKCRASGRSLGIPCCQLRSDLPGGDAAARCVSSPGRWRTPSWAPVEPECPSRSVNPALSRCRFGIAAIIATEYQVGG